MIRHWFIKKVPLVFSSCTLMVAAMVILGRLAPARPQIYYSTLENGQPPEIVALDVNQNFSVHFIPEPPLSREAKINWAISPDGQQFVITNGIQLMLMNPRGSNHRWLTVNKALHYAPDWSPDGRRIVFVSQIDGDSEIYVMDADGNNQKRLTASHIYETSPSWSPDGQHIAFVSYRDGDGEIYVMDSEGGSPNSLTSNDSDDQTPAWSPDGRHIVFSSNRAGVNYQLYIMDADGSGQHLLVSTEGSHTSPSWSPDGKYIMFQDMVNNADRKPGATYIVDADGSHLRCITSPNQPFYGPIWFIPQS